MPRSRTRWQRCPTSPKITDASEATFILEPEAYRPTWWSRSYFFADEAWWFFKFFLDLTFRLNVTETRPQFPPTVPSQEIIDISQGNLLAHCPGDFGEQLLGRKQLPFDGAIFQGFE